MIFSNVYEGQLIPTEGPDIIFNSPTGKEIMRVTDNGIEYQGRTLELDNDVEEAFRVFLRSQGFV